MAERVRVKLIERPTGVPTVFRDPQDVRIIEGCIQVLDKDGLNRYTYPLSNVAAVLAETV